MPPNGKVNAERTSQTRVLVAFTLIFVKWIIAFSFRAAAALTRMIKPEPANQRKPFNRPDHDLAIKAKKVALII